MRFTLTKFILQTFWLATWSPTTTSALSQDVIPARVNTGYRQTVLEVHNVVMTVQQDALLSRSPEYQLEKAVLFDRMRRSNGQWNDHHPRYRLLQALYSFRKYGELHEADLERWKGLFKHVSKKQKEILEHVIDYSAKFNTMKQLIWKNAAICESIVKHALQFYEVEETELVDFIRDKERQGGNADKTSVEQALKHIVRDWTTTGTGEREAGFQCIIDTMTALLGNSSYQDGKSKVMIPGSGLGRLGHDVAQLGYEVFTNEWSMYMNAAYRFMEAGATKDAYTFYPFVENWSHHTTYPDMVRQVSFPDSDINNTVVIHAEGDFTTLPQHHIGNYDIVITYFFIDTARNIMSYLETIDSMLKPGGYWINFGPLLYGSAPFVQLSLEEIIIVGESMGFAFIDLPLSCGELTWSERTVRGKDSVYGLNEKSLVRLVYNGQSWLARKAS